MGREERGGCALQRALMRPTLSIEIAHQTLRLGFGTTLLRAIVAGWLIALIQFMTARRGFGC